MHLSHAAKIMTCQIAANQGDSKPATRSDALLVMTCTTEYLLSDEQYIVRVVPGLAEKHVLNSLLNQ